jgi:hypothetical protein
MARVVCPNCDHGFEVLASRKTNHGYEHAKDLAYRLNTETIYSAAIEPRSKGERLSGSRVRPDIKVTRRDAVAGAKYVLIERQEENTPGTGHEKIPNKILKAQAVLRAEPQCAMFYFVFAGKKVAKLETAFEDALHNGVFDHERVRHLREDAFLALAKSGGLPI